MSDVVWQEEFPKSYRVPGDIIKLVYSDILTDLSWRNDPAPSFGVKLRDKNWVRLWVEHPDPARRLGWEDRYTVVVQPEPSIPFGWKLLGTEDLYIALDSLIDVIKMRGPKCHFKIETDGVA